MKNIKLLVFGLITIIGIASCNKIPTNKKTDLPNEIVKLKENKVFDTTISISTEDNTYMFDYKSQSNDYVTTVSKTSDETSFFVFGVIMGALISIVIGLNIQD